MQHSRLLRFSLIALCGGLAFLWWQAPRQDSAAKQSAATSAPSRASGPSGTALRPVAPSMPAVSAAAPAEVRAFRDWAQTYFSTPPAERASLETQGAELARAHTQVIAALIRKNPQQAIENAVPMVIRQDLPSSIVDLLEKRQSLKASLNLCGNVPLEGTELPPDFEPYTRSVTTDAGVYFKAFVYGPREQQRTITQASLNGISVGRDMAVADTTARSLEVGERPNVAGREVVEVCPVSNEATPVERTESNQLPAVTEETPALETAERIIYVCSGGHITQVVDQLAAQEEREHWASLGVVMNSGAGSGSGTAPLGSIPGNWTTGQRKLLYIRATFPDHRIDPQSEAESHDMLRQMADFISQASYGRCYVTYAVAPLVVLPYPESWYVQYAADNGDADSLILKQARTIAKTMGFDYLSYDLDAVRWNGGGGFSSFAFVGSRGLGLRINNVTTFCHELGHNLGLWHANTWVTSPPSTIGPGTNYEYGNKFDVMGSGNSTDAHYTASTKNILSWLPTETHWSVTQSGLYRIHQFDQPVADPSMRYALRVKKDAEREYWAEFRQRMTNFTGLMNGLMITWDGWGQGGIGGSGGSPPDGSNAGAQLLDMTPGSFGDGVTETRNDSALWVGRTFSDYDANIHITPVAQNMTTTPPSMDVYVSVGDAAAKQPPTLAITASVTNPAINTSITLTAAATDPNGDPLAYAWVFGDGTYSTNNSAVQTKSWSSSRHYNVLCTASDMKGHRTTRALLITVGSPTTFTVSGNISGPDSKPLEGVYVANYAPSNWTTHGNSSTFKGTWTDSAGNYTLTGLAAGSSYTISPNLYPNTFTVSGFTNPVAVGSNVTGKNFTSTLLPTIKLNVTDASANEGTTPGTGTVRIERTGSTTNALQVQIFDASTGTATRNIDYKLSPAPTPSTNSGGSGASLYTIPAGATFLDITVTPVNDTTPEGTEYAVLNFANTSAGYILAGPAVATVAITDDENATLPVVKLLALDDVAAENGADTATLSLERNGATTSPLTVNLTYTGTATSGADYNCPASVIIPAGSASATFTLTPTDDTLQEGTETAIVTITTNAAYARDTLANTQTVNLHDNDLPSVSVVATDATATETPGDLGVFTVTRSGGDPTQALTVDYALAGRAVHGADYRRLEGHAVIPAGVMSTQVVIEPIDDAVDEDLQDVIICLRSATTYAISGTSTATVNITDNDGSQVYVKLIKSAVVEPATGSITAISFQIIRPASDNAITVNYAISGTATSGVDFTALPGTIAFAAGDTSMTINVSALADTKEEDAETVKLTLLPGTGYTLMANQDPSATGFILDQQLLMVNVSVADTGSTLTTTGTETSTGNALRFVVSRINPVSTSLVLNYTMSGTATEGVDYTGTTGSVTIPANATSAFVTLTPVNDTIAEGVESIIMTLTPATGTYGVRIGSATMLLGDNDSFASGTVAFTATTSTVAENGGTHKVAVSLSGTPPGAVKVNYRVSGGSATGNGDDFTLAEGLLTFPVGTTSINIPIPIKADTIPEPAETIELQLFNASGANLGGSTHTVTINNLSLPEAFTDAPTSVLTSSVSLNGRVLPNGVATEAWFEYGPTTAYGSTTAHQVIGSGTASVAVTAAISGFAPGSYHFRCVASNSMGVTKGIDQVVPTATATLSGLGVSAGALSPTFKSTTKNYSLVVGATTNTLTVTPTASDAAASIKVNTSFVPSGGSTTLSLVSSSTVVTIAVTSPDQSVTTNYKITVTRQTPYEAWAAAQALSGLNSGPTEDFDGDGNVNFIEYALNTDPKVASGIPLDPVVILLNTADNEYYLTVSHRRRIVPGTLTYSFQSSTNLSTWADVAAAQLVLTGVVSVGDGITEVATFRILPSLQDAPGSRFLRLKVSE